MSSTTIPLSLGKLEQIEKYYAFRERSQVLEVLKQFSFLIPILLKVPEKIHQYFPENTPLILAVEIDPETSTSDGEELTLLIASELDPDDCLEYLWQLDKDFKLDDLDKTQGKLLLNIGY